MFNPITWFTGGWQGYVAAAGLSALVVVPATAWLTSKPYQIAIAKMERDKAQGQADSWKALMDQFAADAARVHESAQTYQSIKGDMDAKFAALTKDFRDATRLHPLPVDCVPDDFRVRSFHQAIDTANRKQGEAGLVPSSRLPAVTPAPGR